MPFVRDNSGCLVLDLRMPGVGGLDLLSRRSLQAGAVAFLEKPVPRAKLLDAVRTALGAA
jgi:FixJ family two-component response regulator